MKYPEDRRWNNNSKMLNSGFHCFHRYWIKGQPLNASKKQSVEEISWSTIYKCRLIPDSFENDSNNFYAIKVISYTDNEKKEKKRGVYAPINPYTKTFQQIETEYLVLQILNKCHRISKLKEILHENPKREDDKEFFYRFLKKPKTKEQRYVCFVTQFCNEGTLDDKIEKSKKGFSKEEVVVYAAQIIEGLFELKKKNIIHRDLRPCNILIHNGEVKFSDFDTAFIGGKSNWMDVKNGIDIETSPPQIIELASKPDEELMKFDKDQLYQRQEKSDNYFFGLALFKMIYGYNYQKFTKSTLENLISEMLTFSDHSPKLLELMAGCLEERVDKRIDFFTLYTEFRELEKEYYFQKRIINKIYLSGEPFCFASYKSMNKELELLMKMKDCVSYMNSVPTDWSQINLKDELDKSAKNRLTKIYSALFEDKDANQLWRDAEMFVKQQETFNEKMQEFIRTFSVRTYFYECLYKASLSIDIKSIKNKQFKITVRESKRMLEQELTLVLAFLFQLLFNTPFKRDKFYNIENLPYEARKLFNNMIKSDIIQNKMNCYKGKSRAFDSKNTQIGKRIETFCETEFKDRETVNFDPIHQETFILLKDIEKMVNKILRETIIKLRHAYQTMDEHTSGIREILFVLIALQQQSLESLRKNDILKVWESLMPLISEEVQLDGDEIEIFFEQYKFLYSEDEEKITRENNLLSVKMFVLQQNPSINIDLEENEADQVPDKSINLKRIEISEFERDQYEFSLNERDQSQFFAFQSGKK